MAPTEKGDFLKKVASIILAGGQGTRLYPLTAHRCKPAVCFGGKFRLIDVPLSNSLNARINQIFVLSQYFAAELHQHIFSSYQPDLFRTGALELLTPQETSLGKELFKGTADAVRQSLDYILRSTAEFFLILSGDQLYNMDLYDLLGFAKSQDADLVIASIAVNESDAKRMGLLKVNDHTQITDFAEKPKDPKILKEFALAENSYLASMGIYVFKRAALIKILLEEGNDFGHDLIPPFIKKNRCVAYRYKGYWEDIGTIVSFYNANMNLTERKGLYVLNGDNAVFSQLQHVPSAWIHKTKIINSIISQCAVIEAEEIRNSVIGSRTLIKQGTIIHDSVVLGNQNNHPFLDPKIAHEQYFSIGENCHIKKAIIDEESRIGSDVHLTNEAGLETFDGEGIFIRDGIIIVTSGTELPDGFRL